MASSSFLTFNKDPPSSRRTVRTGGKSFSGIALSTSFTLDSKLILGGVLASSSRMRALRSRNCRDRSFPGLDMRRAQANHSQIAFLIWKKEKVNNDRNTDFTGIFN